MATVRVKFRASSVSDREGTLFFQVIHNRTARQISTEYRLFEWEWNADRGEAVLTKAADLSRRNYLAAVNNGIRYGMVSIMGVISRMEQSGRAYTADDVVSDYAGKSKEEGFLSFVRKRIEHLLRSNKRSAAEKTQYALNSFYNFVGKDDVPFAEIDGNLMEEYEGWLRARGVCKNTVSFYMRTLRTLYNMVVERGLTEQRFPFRYVYTGIDKTVKRAVSLKVLIRIQNLDLSGEPGLDMARDLFLFSFFMRGMSFIDMCFLKKTDLVNGVLSYRRQKTGQLLQVKWEKPMQKLVEKLGKTTGKYLLPIITDASTDIWKQYANALRRENRNLKLIGKLIGMETPLTTYVARHTWASVAKCRNIPISAISEGLGHDSVATTKIYLASLDTSVVDRANSQILKLLRKP